MSPTDDTAESYPRLRDLLGEDGFKELARLIRTTYEANEKRRLREGDPAARAGGLTRRRPTAARTGTG